MTPPYRYRLDQAWHELELRDVYKQVGEVVERLASLRWSSSPILVMGNGGSQSTAAHLVLHLRENKIPALDVMADNAYLTMLSNDFSYDEAPAHFRKTFPLSPAFAISGSGDSQNVISLLRDAPGLRIGLLGNNGGQALQYTTRAILLSTDDYSIIEDIHLSLVHMISEGLRGRS